MGGKEWKQQIQLPLGLSLVWRFFVLSIWVLRGFDHWKRQEGFLTLREVFCPEQTDATHASRRLFQDTGHGGKEEDECRQSREENEEQLHGCAQYILAVHYRPQLRRR